jgi:hypothetical protein
MKKLFQLRGFRSEAEPGTCDIGSKSIMEAKRTALPVKCLGALNKKNQVVLVGVVPASVL